MTNLIQLTWTLRVENETGLSGTEAQAVEAFDDLDESIAATTEKTLAFAAIKASQLQSMSMLSSQDVSVQFLGPWYNIKSLNAVITVAEAFIEFTGDLSAIIHPGDILRLDGTAAGDGYYMVLNEPQYPVREATAVVFGGADTVISLANGHILANAGAVGRFAKVMSVLHHPIEYTIATMAAGPPGVITFTGDLTEHFAAGDYIILDWGTDTPPGKDGIYRIDTIVFSTPTTTITLTNTDAIADATNDGEFHKIVIAFDLTANTPMMWGKDGGSVNPIQPRGAVYDALQGDVAQALANNLGATAANFQARFPRNGVTP